MTTDQPTTVDDASFADPWFVLGYIDAIARDVGYPRDDAEARADIIAALAKNRLERARAQEITDARIAALQAGYES